MNIERTFFITNSEYDLIIDEVASQSAELKRLLIIWISENLSHSDNGVTVIGFDQVSDWLQMIVTEERTMISVTIFRVLIMY